MKRTLLVSILASSAACLALADEKESTAMKSWPAFRGPLATGVAPHANPPAEWSETENIRWKKELPGPGHASPIVWDDRIYVLAVVAQGTSVAPGDPPPEARGHGRRPRVKPTAVHQFVVIALERKTGETIWQTVVREEVPHESGHQTASQASPSPVTDGTHVYAHFGSRGLYCLDRDGKVKWQRDFGEMSTRNEFGEGSSPALHGNTLVVNWDHEGDSFIVALDKRSGEELWRVARGEPTSWSTPLIVEDGGRPLAVVSATRRVRAYDLKTGREVWACGGLGVNCIPTPVADAERVFVMSGYREAAGMAIRYPGAKGDITESDAVAWRLDRGLSYVPSPLLYDGKLYVLERFRAVLSCLDLGSGEAHYREQRLEGLGNIYASPVAADGRIYVIDRSGKAVVFRHGSKFELLAENELDDAFDATPAIAGDELYLRGHRHLYCVAESRAPLAPPTASAR